MDQALRFAIEMADAPDQAHRKGVFHRDLKPGNIMLIKSGTKLPDFGLAKVGRAFLPASQEAAPTLSETLTEKGTILGTLQYMAPEQLEGKATDARTDIFVFGAVIYEMATGRKAFEGKSAPSLMAAILEHDPPPDFEPEANEPAGPGSRGQDISRKRPRRPLADGAGSAEGHYVDRRMQTKARRPSRAFDVSDTDQKAYRKQC